MPSIKKLLKISIIKTIHFNFHYFGFKGMFNPKVILAKNVKLKDLRGSIELKNINQRIQIGFTNEYPEPSKREHTYFWNQGGKIIFQNEGYFDFCKGTSICVGGEHFNY